MGVNAKYRRLAEIMEGKIACGIFPKDETFPSIRQLMMQTGLSLNTVRKAVALLGEKGILEFRHGNGTYVTGQKPRPTHDRITVISVNFGTARKQSLTGLAMLGVRKAASSANLQIHHKIMYADECSDKTLHHASLRSDGLILLGGYDAGLRELNLDIPVIGVGMHESFGGKLSVIDLDPVLSAEMAADYFKKRNILNLILVGHDRLNFEFRRSVFKEYWIRCGGSITAEFMEHTEFFRKDTGILYFYGDDAVSDLEQYTKTCGQERYLNVPLLCMDGKPLFGQTIYGQLVPTLAVNWFEAGELAVAEFVRRISSSASASRRIYLPPKLYHESFFMELETEMK